MTYQICYICSMSPCRHIYALHTQHGTNLAIHKTLLQGPSLLCLLGPESLLWLPLRGWACLCVGLLGGGDSLLGGLLCVGSCLYGGLLCGGDSLCGRLQCRGTGLCGGLLCAEAVSGGPLVLERAKVWPTAMAFGISGFSGRGSGARGRLGGADDVVAEVVGGDEQEGAVVLVPAPHYLTCLQAGVWVVVVVQKLVWFSDGDEQEGVLYWCLTISCVCRQGGGCARKVWLSTASPWCD
jgi:hypothetical protein